MNDNMTELLLQDANALYYLHWWIQQQKEQHDTRSPPRAPVTQS